MLKTILDLQGVMFTEKAFFKSLFTEHKLEVYLTLLWFYKIQPTLQIEGRPWNPNVYY